MPLVFQHALCYNDLMRQPDSLQHAASPPEGRQSWARDPVGWAIDRVLVPILMRLDAVLTSRKRLNPTVQARKIDDVLQKMQLDDLLGPVQVLSGFCTLRPSTLVPLMQAMLHAIVGGNPQFFESKKTILMNRIEDILRITGLSQECYRKMKERLEEKIRTSCAGKQEKDQWNMLDFLLLQADACTQSLRETSEFLSRLSYDAMRSEVLAAGCPSDPKRAMQLMRTHGEYGKRLEITAWNTEFIAGAEATNENKETMRGLGLTYAFLREKAEPSQQD